MECAFWMAYTAWKVSTQELFRGPLFPHSDWIRKDTKYLYLFSPNVGKYGPGITPYLDNFHAVIKSITSPSSFVFLKTRNKWISHQVSGLNFKCSKLYKVILNLILWNVLSDNLKQHILWSIWNTKSSHGLI